MEIFADGVTLARNTSLAHEGFMQAGNTNWTRAAALDTRGGTRAWDRCPPSRVGKRAQERPLDQDEHNILLCLQARCNSIGG